MNQMKSCWTFNLYYFLQFDCFYIWVSYHASNLLLQHDDILGHLARDTEAAAPVREVEREEDDWEDDPAVLVDITAAHA